MRRAPDWPGEEGDIFFRILSAIGKRIGKPTGWERFVRLWCSPESIRGRPAQLIALRDEPLIIADPKTPLGWNLLLFGSYEPELRACFQNFLRPGFVAVDVGANVGWHTLLMAKCVGDQGRVIAFEPNPSVRERLEFHVSLNRFRQVEVLPYALSDREGIVQFTAPPVDDPRCGDGCMLPTSTSSISPSEQNGASYRPAASAVALTGISGTAHQIEVKATPLDALLDRLALSRLDLIKMDIEGFEWLALNGSTRAIEQFRPHIVFEFDREYIARCNGSREQFSDFLAKHRYQLFVATHWGLDAVEANAWPNSANFWAVPRP